jgi:hypothetical protein
MVSAGDIRFVASEGVSGQAFTMTMERGRILHTKFTGLLFY